MIYQIVTKYEFVNQFLNSGRASHDGKKGFSIEGLEALYDYLEDTHQELELDVIALCCEFSEGTIKEALEDYDLESLEDLEDQTMVLRLDSGDRIIYQVF